AEGVASKRVSISGIASPRRAGGASNFVLVLSPCCRVTKPRCGCGPNQRAGTLSHLGLRETKKRRQREAVERAALDLFARQGYEQTTVHDICAVAEVGHATFYRYFPTKEDVVFGHRDAYLDALTRMIERDDELVPSSMIHNVMVAFAGYLADDAARPAR